MCKNRHHDVFPVFPSHSLPFHSLEKLLGLDKPIKPYCTYLYRNKVLVITKVTTQDTPKPVFKELCHRLYRNLKLPTNTVRQSTATSQFNRSDEKLFWAPKQGNHSLLLRALKTVMHCGKCDWMGNSPTTMVCTDEWSAYKRTRKMMNRLLEMVELLMTKRQFWSLSASVTKIWVARNCQKSEEGI
jgi:hypothetical protein